ncbi:MAG TPA: hypothetical protein VEY67_06410, partial [Candidatus Dormibacteraeota bacterium]|nr:hypothetical protein [Candidatus Dormibacteraeota bacterium]
VGVAALPAALIAASGLVWPPIARGDRAFWAIGALGVAALLLLVPSLAGLAAQLEAGGPQTLLPSPEAAYPWLLALGATALFAGLGIARRVLGETAVRRRRMTLGIAIATAATFLSGGLFAGAAVANDLALRDRPAVYSPFGPTDPRLEPSACDAPIVVARSARVDLLLTGDVDLGSIGQAHLSGVRDGADARWIADVATSTVFGTYGGARVGTRTWSFDTARGWVAGGPAGADVPSLDRLVVATVLAPRNRAPAESLGIGFVEGARARHCRIAVAGPTFREAFPQVAWLVGDDPLARWRGSLEYWVFADAGVGQVTGSVNGEGAGLTPKGIQGTIRVTMTATDRGRYVGVPAPSR